MLNITKVGLEDEENIFKDPFSETWIKILAATSTTITAAAGALMVVITCYERAGYFAPYRSLINQLMSWINIFGISFIAQVMLVDLTRVFVGPLPKMVCNISYIARGTLANGVVILMTAITITKYMMICVWKNLPMMDENFLASFISKLAFLMGLLSGLIKFYQPGRLVFNQVNCYGEYYESWNEMPSKFPSEAIISGLPLILHIALSIRIYVQSKRYDHLDNQAQQIRTPHHGQRNIGSLLFNFIILFYECIQVYFLGQVNRANPSKWAEYPHNFYISCYLFSGVAFLFVVLVLIQGKSIKSALKLANNQVSSR